MDIPPINGLPPSVPIRKSRIRDENNPAGRQFERAFQQNTGDAETDGEERAGLEENPVLRRLQEQQAKRRKKPSEGEHHLDVMA